MASTEDEAWRAIVENYGERVDLGPDPFGTGEHDPGASDGRGNPDGADGTDLLDPDQRSTRYRDGDLFRGLPDAARPEDRSPGEPGSSAAQPPADERSWDNPFPDDDWSEDRFVPPPPPPLPKTTPDRFLAWFGVLGSPAILLILLLLQVSIPRLLAWALVIAFVGGFGYLVAKMPSEPRDPNDDGAVV